jgi:hypothetical protein
MKQRVPFRIFDEPREDNHDFFHLASIDFSGQWIIE